MRDEMDGRIWAAHHQQMSKSMENFLAALGGNLSAPPAAAKHLIVGAASLGMALLTLGGSVA